MVQLYRAFIHLFCSGRRLLAVGLQQFNEYVKNQSSSTTNTTHEALKLVVHYLLPNCTPTSLRNLIKRKGTDDSESSSIKVRL